MTAPARPPKVALVRWKAALPLGLGLLVLVLGWIFCGGWLVKRILEAAGTVAVGAKVEIATVDVSLAQSRLTIRGLTVASAKEAFKNTLQADELDADFETLPLFRKKFIVDRLAATGLRFGTPRTTDGRVKQPAADTTPPAPTGAGKPSATGTAVEDIVDRLNLPGLDLSQGKIEVGALDPSKLGTAAAARALEARADSSSRAWTAALNDLRTGPTVDSALALANRLKGAKPTDLSALNDARRMLTLLSSAKDKVDALGRSIAAGAADLQHGVAGLDSAKARDLATARSLVHLPALDPAQIGAALFGSTAAGRFETALHWVRLARRYTPPGLLPHASPAPKRVRRAGLTVRFPREHDLPAFWLKDAAVSFTLDSAKRYDGRLRNLTTSQTLAGQPTTFTAQAPAVQMGALLDHRRPTALDTASGTLSSVRLPDLGLPAGVRVVPGTGSMALRFALEGENLRAAWEIHSSRVTWARDSTAGRSPAGDLLWQVLSGVSALDLTAQLSGTASSPALAIHSNLDQALSDRIRSLLGDQVKTAEQKLTAEVNAYADPLIAPVKARITAVSDAAQQQLGLSQGKIGDAQKQLQQRLRSLTGGLKLP